MRLVLLVGGANAGRLVEVLCDRMEHLRMGVREPVHVGYSPHIEMREVRTESYRLTSWHAPNGSTRWVAFPEGIDDARGMDMILDGYARFTNS